jgi:hypothetical protein
MRWNTFLRSTLFAAMSAAAYGPFVTIVGPLLGLRSAAGLYAVALATCYVAGLAATGRRRLVSAGAIAMLGLGLVVWRLPPSEVAVSLAVMLGVVRSRVLYRARRSRGLVIEAALVGGGLWFAAFLMASPVLSIALAIWGFFLVQGLFFLVGRTLRGASAGGTDPFDQAHARAVAVLDRHGI